MTTSRQKLACTTCTKRKIKCDKTIPCANCVARGIDSSCHRDGDRSNTFGHPMTLQIPPPPRPSNNGPARDVESLSRRVADLESALARALSSLKNQRPVQESNDTKLLSAVKTPPAHSRAATASPGVGSGTDTHEMEDAATVLEFLAWGRHKDQDIGDTTAAHEVDPSRWTQAQRLDLQNLGSLLPDAQRVWAIVEYHRDCLLWYDGTYHAPTFHAEIQNFYSKSGGSVQDAATDILWVSLLFAILCSSLSCASVQTVSRWGFGAAEASDQALEYYQAAMTCLELGDYMSSPCLHSIQTIATLTLPAHLLGHSTKQSILIATGIRLAQTLNMHRMRPETEQNGKLVIERETSRRVWCQLATQDFFSTPFSESHTINLLLTSTEQPRNCHDHDLTALPENIPTVMSFVRFKYDIAVLLPQLQTAMARSKTIYAKYEQVLGFDAKMRKLVTTGRPPFLGPGPLDQSWPRWIPWARRYLRISSAHKIIMMHRKFIGLSFTNPAFAFTRRTCIAASKTILKCQKDEVDHESCVLWIEHAFVVTACVILCFDLLHRSIDDTDWKDHGQTVDDAISILAHSQQSKIAVRGVKLLTALRQNTLNQPRQTARATSRKRSFGDPPSSRVTKPKTRHFDTAGFVNDFLNEERLQEASERAKTIEPVADELFNMFESLEDGFVFGQPLDWTEQPVNDGMEFMQMAFNSPDTTNSLFYMA